MLQRFLIPSLAAFALVAGAAEAAGSDSHEARVRALAAPDCAWSGGALADPAQTQRCLAERFKSSTKRKPSPANAAPPPADGTH